MVTSNDYLAQVELVTESNIPADNIINTFAFTWVPSGTPANSDFLALAGYLSGFYQAWTTYRSRTVPSAGNHQVKFYRLTDPSPRVPVATHPISPGAGSSSADRLPVEVSCCLSIRANYESGSHPARRRGRVFLGPLTQNASTHGADGYPRPSPTFREVLADAADGLLTATLAGDWSWSVWSRADDELFSVVGGWIEDEWDTQRRRSPSPSTRTIWPIPPG
mgnify:CR=1 FL=1